MLLRYGRKLEESAVRLEKEAVAAKASPSRAVEVKATMLASVAALDARSVVHGTVFRGLDMIDTALSDLAATAAVLDEIMANMSDGDARHEAIDNLFRHLQADLAALQRANDEARASVRKGERA